MTIHCYVMVLITRESLPCLNRNVNKNTDTEVG